MDNKTKSQQEMLELNEQFRAFLHTKGIGAKFKVAFANMQQAANKQHEADKSNFEAIKAQSAEDNKEFVEFLHTKGLKAKYNLVVENIKNNAKTLPYDTAAQIEKINAQAQGAISRANTYKNSYGKVTSEPYTIESLANEFNDFLKAKGLDGKYTVCITEE